ncbi:hypothetical protein AVEN_48693-1 [Araneus ventricosus]|uniref:Gustatory receptor n=1 Tax=Araneus ventricosus TaxID=182803 RepID=A0A4Y2G2R9_ARAVE|nr:hypothetical protein AVEN_48693-1 [Araneus ventricosus]
MDRNRPENQKHSRHVKQKTEWHSQYAPELSPLLKILFWTGLLEDSAEKFRYRILTRIHFGLLVLVTIDVSIIAILLNTDPTYCRVLIHLCTYILIVLTWLAMRRRRKQLSNFLHTLQEISPYKMTEKAKFLLYCICSAPVILAILLTVSPSRKWMATRLAYGFTSTNVYVQMLVIFLKNTMNHIVYPLSLILIDFLFCSLCQHVCCIIRCLTFEVENKTPETFTLSFQADIIKRKQRIDEALLFMRRVFYYPSFLACAANFCGCCTIVGWILRSDKIDDFVIMVVFFTYFLANISSLLMCLWTAGGLPIELETFNKEFRSKILQRDLLEGKTDEIDFKKYLNDDSISVLSGCDIIHFKRSAILVLAGTIITYALLIRTI